MSLIRELVMLATQPNATISQLCRRYAISRKTAYKWIRRFDREGLDGLSQRSTRPHQSPYQTPQHIEEAILTVRRKHPAWGARKIRHWLIQHTGQARVALHEIPAVSTCQRILKRNHMVAPQESSKHHAWQHFERARPNELWQMDFIRCALERPTLLCLDRA